MFWMRVAVSYLAVQEAEADFGAVDHSAIVLHINAALLPSTSWVIGERGVPFDVLNRLEIFGGHFLCQHSDKS